MKARNYLGLFCDDRCCLIVAGCNATKRRSDENFDRQNQRHHRRAPATRRHAIILFSASAGSIMQRWGGARQLTNGKCWRSQMRRMRVKCWGVRGGGGVTILHSPCAQTRVCSRSPQLCAHHPPVHCPLSCCVFPRGVRWRAKGARLSRAEGGAGGGACGVRAVGHLLHG